jgi:AraC family transcriptional regulator of adaptative response/methylated-DNA-[protein]-cysteine methyltransferase
VCRYIERHLDEPLTLAVLAPEVRLSSFHLQRTFKAILGVSPREYADACRLNTLKGQLRSGHNVTYAMMDAGYGSTSRLYERTNAQLGMTPTEYRAGGRGMRIHYAVVDSPLGALLVAATQKGVCSIKFGDTRPELAAALREEYPAAEIMEDAGEVTGWAERILRYMVGEHRELNLPLDIQATAFQRRVWEYLRTIPYGDTRSYGEVAAALEQPRAPRAVARACASNPVALAIPCHRVVRGDGEAGGYRWGEVRKQALLRQERSGRS